MFVKGSRWRAGLPGLIAGVLLCLAAQASADTQSDIRRKLDAPVPGGVAVLSLGKHATPPRASYLGRPVMVIQDATQAWMALVGIPLSTAAGTQYLALNDSAGERKLAFQVREKNYAAQHIALKNTRQVNPDPDDLKRIERELAEQTRAYQSYRADVAPDNLLLDKPVQGRLSSPFGLQRFFNGEARNPHSGLDFAVPAGTPVTSPAAGRVILIGEYFFNGKTVFVDHGQGFISMFCHLSAVSVTLGDELARGAVLGRVGSTGRATGPHLHWNVSLNDARVDPAIFIGAFKP